MVTCNQLTRIYGNPDHPVTAVERVDLEIAGGDFLAITGASGSGKSTLLHLIGSLDSPTSGELTVAGLRLHEASEVEKNQFRRDTLGIVFQFFNLLPTLTVRENVMLPLTLRGARGAHSSQTADEMLDLVGLRKRSSHFSGELSGGEMQRVAIARALAHQPALVIADEPTGNLDSKNRDRVLEILQRIHHEKLTTLVVVTHEEEVAEIASRRAHMADGHLSLPEASR